MEGDSYTEVTSESWFGRIGNSLVGVLIGFVLIAGSTAFLFWNEGRTVKQYRTLKEGVNAVVSVSSDSVLYENDGQLVHMKGHATTEEILQDPQFPVSANAISLKRTARMYQWKEKTSTKKRKKLGGGEETVKTYNYSKEWSSSLIDSSHFKKSAEHRNPDSMMFKTRTINADNVTIGAYQLSKAQIRKINAYQSLPVSNVSEIPDVGKPVSAQNGDIYIGNDQYSPEIGDMMIAYSIVPPTDITLVAKQEGSSFTPYVTSNGGSINELAAGTFTAAEMFEKAQTRNTIFAWVFRAIGFVLSIVGFGLLFKPISVLADIVPFFGNIVEFGTGIIAFLLALILSLTTIAVSWIFYRPVLAVGLLAATIGIIYYLLAGKKGKTSARQKARRPQMQQRRQSPGNDAEPANASKKQSFEDPFLTGDD